MADRASTLTPTLPSAGLDVVAQTYPGWRAVRRNDVTHRLLGDAGQDGGSHAAAARGVDASPGRFTGQDNGWVGALTVPVVMEFNKSIVDYPSMNRVPGGASTDWRPNL